MLPDALDRCMDALRQTLKFYDKDIDAVQIGFWKAYIKKQDESMFKRALVMHTEKSRFAPKPSDMGALVAQLKDDDRRAANMRTEAPKEPTSEDKALSEAWMYWMQPFHGMALFSTRQVDPEKAYEYLLLINQTVKAGNQHDAVPDEFKLEEVWGMGLSKQEVLDMVAR